MKTLKTAILFVLLGCSLQLKAEDPLIDIGLTQVLQPAAVIEAGSMQVGVNVKNFASTPISQFTINFEVNGVLWIPYNYDTPTLQEGQSIDLNIGAYDFLPNTTYDIKIWLEMVNGQEDINSSNDTITIQTVTYPETLVYPGDVNHDQVANGDDLLYLGLKHGISGEARVNASTEWLGQLANNWDDYQYNDKNTKHADCNGDGTVDDGDIAAIRQNYMLVHDNGKTDDFEVVEEGSLKLELPTEITAGETVSLAISLGDGNTPVDEFYGISLSLDFEAQYVAEGSFTFDYGNSWIGAEESFITLDTVFHDNGKMDINISRTNQQSISGGGILLNVSFAMADEIIGKDLTASMPFSINVSRLKVINHKAEIFPMEVTQAESVIMLSEEEDDITSLDSAIEKNAEVQVLPQPNEQQITLIGTGIQACQVFNLQGQLVASQEFGTVSHINMKTRYLPPNNVYVLWIQTTDGTHCQKVFWR